MADDVIAAGKSKEEIAYGLMINLMTNASDKPANPSRQDYLNHFAAARSVVYGDPSEAAAFLKK